MRIYYWLLAVMLIAGCAFGGTSQTQTKRNSIGSCFCVKSDSDSDSLTNLECVTFEHHIYKSRKFYRQNVLVYWSLESDQSENKPWPRLPIPKACRLPKRKEGQ